METSWILTPISECSEEELRQQLEHEKEEHEKTKAQLLRKEAHIKRLQDGIGEVHGQLKQALETEYRHVETKQKQIEQLYDVIRSKNQTIKKLESKIGNQECKLFFNRQDMEQFDKDLKAARAKIEGLKEFEARLEKNFKDCQKRFQKVPESEKGLKEKVVELTLGQLWKAAGDLEEFRKIGRGGQGNGQASQKTGQVSHKSGQGNPASGRIGGQVALPNGQAALPNGQVALPNDQSGKRLALAHQPPLPDTPEALGLQLADVQSLLKEYRKEFKTLASYGYEHMDKEVKELSAKWKIAWDKKMELKKMLEAVNNKN